MIKFLMVVIAVLACIISFSDAYFAPSLAKRARASQSRQSMELGLFGGGKKSGNSGKKVVIKADGKTIEADTSPCNLRKELQKAKIDVYPLRAKFTGNCGGAGICGTCAVKVQSGMKNINPASKNEQNTLKTKCKDAADVRLSCCARVSGPVEVKTKVY